MSKDLIKRLRNMELNPCSRPQARWGEAADEIERLQAENDRLHEGLPPEFVPIQDNNNASDKDSEIERLRKRVERLDDLLEIIDRPVPKDGLRSWRYDIHAARSRVERKDE